MPAQPSDPGRGERLGAQILVVEDDDALRYFLTRVLQREGHQVSEASSLAAGLARLRSGGIDVVILDVRLPDGNGVEACQQIRADPRLRATIVLEISGVDTSFDAQADGLIAGADGYLVKPVHERVLIAQVEALLRLRTAERALVNQQRTELDALTVGSEAPEGGAPEGGPGIGPAQRARWSEQYERLLQRAVEEQRYKVERTVPARLDALSAELYAAQAGPRDVIALHSEALRRAVESTFLQPSTQRALVEEGRLTALQLMGYLLTRYRNARVAGR